MKRSLVFFFFLFLAASIGLGQNYYQSGGNVTLTNQLFSATTTNTSGVLVTQGGILDLSNSTVTTSGNTTSDDSSSFYGLNAGVLANRASTITLTGCKITTTGTGANGVFATDTLSSVILVSDTIYCTNNGGHGVDATFGASLNLTDVVISTTGAHGAAISTDRGGETINVLRGYATSSGQDSPGIYCTGNITATDAIISGTGSEGAVIEGANTITLVNTTLSGAVGTRDRGIFIYQSMSGDATGNRGVFTMSNGVLNWPSTSGPLFYITNTTGVITLTDVTINSSSQTLIKASKDSWGTSGKNGGIVEFTASGENLNGNVLCDSISTVAMKLTNTSSLEGAVNTENSAKLITLTMDAGSSWNVTADSYVQEVIDSGGVAGQAISNISGNGYTVTYDGTLSANSYLGQKIYNLQNGGVLTCPTCTPWGIDDKPENKATVSVYPNPAKTVLNISTGKPLPQLLQIFTVCGEKKYETYITGTTTVDVSEWTEGIYFLRQDEQVLRVVVMHL